MITRRQFVLSTTATVGGYSLLQVCSSQASEDNYEKVVSEIWQHKLKVESINGHFNDNVYRDLVRYATLAPSSHNTQCWKFKIQDKSIAVLPDLSRRCPAVDPDDHHLFVSLGCATENLIQAALAHGLKAEPSFEEKEDGKIKISLDPTAPFESPLFKAISERQCTRSEYDSKPLATQELSILERAGTGKSVQVLMLTERNRIENILEYVVEANSKQMKDPSFIKELKTWIRFDKAEAIHKGDGLLSLASDNPALPTWLGNLIFGMVFSPKSENEKYVKQVRSSAGIAIFISDENRKENWIEVGRSYERFALQAAALGIRNAFLNQPVEVLSMQRQFAEFLGIGNRRPDLIVRFGRSAKMPRSVRRPIDTVLI